MILGGFGNSALNDLSEKSTQIARSVVAERTHCCADWNLCYQLCVAQLFVCAFACAQMSNRPG
jgi:hypothetical protein